MSVFHPDLWFGRFLPRFSFGPLTTRLLTILPGRDAPPPEDVDVADVEVPGPVGAPPVLVRCYRPRVLTAPAPALLWVHGGGLVFGDHRQDEQANLDLARTLGISVFSMRYRLAPRHRAPAAVEDAYAAFTWLVGAAAERGVDPARIAVGGASAGGGIAAALALMARDRGGPQPAFQLLVYPMLDDRTVPRTESGEAGFDTRDARIWSPGSNRYGWTSYLGGEPGRTDVPAYAAAARHDDLTGLPPAWVGVGTLDLFHEEDLAYARRLEADGVPCEVEVVDGAFHGFDAIFPRTGVSRAFWRAQARALGRALDTRGRPAG